MYYEKDNYVEIIKEKIALIDDEELSSLINKLIEERTYLNNIIKIDSLTGVYNRRILVSIRSLGTFIMCDIDNFKQINDTYGHETGDIVLKEISHIFISNIRINDIVCRLGGDEFLIIIYADDYDLINNRINKICDEVRNCLVIPNYEITLSVGIAFADILDTVNSLLNKSDTALYESKENGKNQITYYSSEMKLKKDKQNHFF